MDQLKTYKLATLGLLLLNLALVAFVFFSPGPPGKERMAPPHQFFQFSEAQHVEFLDSATHHEEDMVRINHRQREILREYFKGLKQGTGAESASLSPEFSQLEVEKVAITFRHFLAVRDMLEPEQLEKFPLFLDQALRRVLPRGPQQKRRKKSGNGNR